MELGDWRVGGGGRGAGGPPPGAGQVADPPLWEQVHPPGQPLLLHRKLPDLRGSDRSCCGCGAWQNTGWYRRATAAAPVSLGWRVLGSSMLWEHAVGFGCSAWPTAKQVAR